MTEHEGTAEWIYSSSGQEDTMSIVCSCGWRTRAVWSRLALPAIQQAFAQHQAAAIAIPARPRELTDDEKIALGLADAPVSTATVEDPVTIADAERFAYMETKKQKIKKLRREVKELKARLAAVTEEKIELQDAVDDWAAFNARRNDQIAKLKSHVHELEMRFDIARSVARKGHGLA